MEKEVILKKEDLGFELNKIKEVKSFNIFDDRIEIILEILDN